MLIIIIIYVTFLIGVGILGDSMRAGFAVGFFASLILSPIIGLIIVISMGPKDKTLVAILTPKQEVQHIEKHKLTINKNFIEKSKLTGKFNVGKQSDIFKSFKDYDDAVEYLKSLYK